MLMGKVCPAVRLLLNGMDMVTTGSVIFVPSSALGEVTWILMSVGVTDVFTTAIPAVCPEGSLTATPRTGPEGTWGRVLPWPIGLGSVLESCHWNIPPAGTLVSKTFRPIVPAGNGGGVGEGVGTGVGVGVGVRPPALALEPPHPQEPKIARASKAAPTSLSR